MARGAFGNKFFRESDLQKNLNYYPGFRKFPFSLSLSLSSDLVFFFFLWSVELLGRKIGTWKKFQLLEK